MTEKEAFAEVMKRIQGLIGGSVNKPVYFKKYYGAFFSLDRCSFFTKEDKLLFGFISTTTKRVLCDLDFSIHKVLIRDNLLADVREKIVEEMSQYQKTWDGSYLRSTTG